jgi:hypothetical protein
MSYYTSTRGIVHLSKQYSSISLSLDFYTVAAQVFACRFPYVSPLLWLRFASYLYVIVSTCIWFCLPLCVDVD